MFQRDEKYDLFGVTPVENLFIRDYMPAAKGDYVRVYLYALYASCRGDADYGVEALAKELSLSVADTEAALRYWERRHLIARLSDNPPVYRMRHAAESLASGRGSGDEDPLYVAFSENVYAQFDGHRKVQPSEIALAYEWVQDIGLPQEVVLTLLKYCALMRGMQFSFKYAEKLAVRLRESNALTPEDAEAFLGHAQKSHDGARDVLRRMGKRRMPSEDELQMYEKWTGDWGFSHEAILSACAETVKGDPNFGYLDGILSGLRKRGDAQTKVQVEDQLSLERQELAAVREFGNALGYRVPAPTLRATYRRLLAGFPHSVLLIAARQTMRTKGTIENLEFLLEAFAKLGLREENAVRAHCDEILAVNRSLMRIFETCGHDSRPTPADRVQYARWRGMGFNDDMLLLAAEQAKDAAHKSPYITGILNAWREAGVTEPSQVAARRGTDRTSARPGKEVGAHRYEQREYTQNEMEALAVDLFEEARKLNG